MITFLDPQERNRRPFSNILQEKKLLSPESRDQTEQALNKLRQKALLFLQSRQRNLFREEEEAKKEN